MVVHAQMAAELCLPCYDKLVGICTSRIIGIDDRIDDDQFSINTGSDRESCEIAENGMR